MAFLWLVNGGLLSTYKFWDDLRIGKSEGELPKCPRVWLKRHLFGRLLSFREIFSGLWLWVLRKVNMCEGRSWHLGMVIPTIEDLFAEMIVIVACVFSTPLLLGWWRYPLHQTNGSWSTPHISTRMILLWYYQQWEQYLGNKIRFVKAETFCAFCRWQQKQQLSFFHSKQPL